MKTTQPATISLRNAHKNRRRSLRRSILATSATASLALMPCAHGAADNWTGASSAVWNLAGNWSGGIPINTSQVAFPSVIPGTGSSITMTTGLVADTLSFAGSYSLVGGNLTLTTGTIDVASGKTATFGTTLLGGATITKTGAGILALTNPSSSTGGTVISGGTLSTTASGQLGTGDLTVNNGGTFLAAGTQTFANTATLTLNGGSTVAAAAGTTLTLVPSSISVGSGGGTVTFGNTGNTGTIVIGNSSSQTIGAVNLNIEFGTVRNAGTSVTSGLSFLTQGASLTTVFAGATMDLDDHDLKVQNLTGGGSITLGSNAATTLFIVNTSGPFGFTGNISGSGGVTIVTGGGALLSGASTYTGTTTVQSGATLISGNNSAFGNTTPLVVNGTGTVDLNGHSMTIASLAGEAGATVRNINSGAVTLTIAGTNVSPVTYAGIITDTAVNSLSLIKTGAGRQILTGANTYHGTTTINQGVLQVGDGTAIGSKLGSATVTLVAGNLDINLANGESFANQVDTQAGATVRAIGANTNIISGAIVNTGGLEQIGTGRTILTNTNTYSGPTTVTNGVLQVGNGLSGSIAVGSAVTVGATGQLDINLANGGVFGNAVANSGNVVAMADVNNTLSGIISGAGNLVKTGTGTATVTGANNYTGNTTVNNGVLLVGNASALGVNSPTTVFSPGILDLGGFSITIGGLFGTGTVRNNGAAATLTVGGGNATGSFSGVIQDGTSGTGGLSLVKTGSGSQVLGGTNTFTGTVAVNDGDLQLNGGAALADTVAVTVTSPGNLNLGTASETIGSITGTGNVNLNAFTLTTGGNNNSTNLSGVISGVGGGLTKVGSGTMELSGGSANTYTGLTTVSAGTLSLNKSTGPAIAGNLLINGTGTAKLLGFGQIANSATVTVDAGTFDLNGFNERIATLAGAGGIVNLPGGGLRILNGSTTYSGNIIGTGTFRVTGGTQTLAGSNTYSGQTTISTGTLKAASNTALSPNSNFSLGNLGVLDLNGTTSTIGALIGTDSNANVTNSSATPALLTVGSNNASGSYAGGINDSTGMVSLTKTGTGTQTLAGTNTFTGTVTVNNGTLSLSGGAAIADSVAVTITSPGVLNLVNSETIGSLAGGGITALNANTLTTGGNNASTTYGGAITGTGGIVKNGTGKFTLNGLNPYSGGTTLNAGTLAVGNTNALGQGNVTVNGGTLRNAGTPVAVNIGSGNIAINGGTAMFAVGGTTPGVNHDQIKTTGTLGTINGKLSLVQLNGYTLQPGDKVNLIVAGVVTGGSKTGTALSSSQVDGLSAFSNTPLLVPTVNLYADPSVTLEAMQGSFAALNGQLNFTPNQSAVAGALDSLTSITGGKTGILSELNFLDTQPLSTLKGNLDKIAPEEFGTFFDISKSLSRTQNRNIMNRTEDIRNQSTAGGGGGTASGGVAFRTGASSVQGGYSSGPVGRPSKEVAQSHDDPWGLWMVGSGEFTRVGSTTNAAGYRYETGGVTAGLDYRFTDHFTLGLSLGYMGTNATLANGGSLDVDGGRVGLYATWFDGGFYVDAAVNGGFNSYKTRRVTPNSTTASASPDGSEVNVLFATGYDWKVGSMKIGPTFSYEYSTTDVDAFTETGAFAPLRVRSTSGESSRTAVGIRASWETEVAGKRVRPELRAAWQHEFGDTSHTITSNFATLGGSAFTVTSPVTGRDSALLGAGVTVLWNETTAIYLNYDGEIGRKNYESHTVSGGLRLQF